MNYRYELKKYYLIVAALLLCLFPYLTAETNILKYGDRQRGQSDSIARKRIALIMSETLKKRERTTPEGIRLEVPVPPSNEALQEVKGYGDKGVSILAEYLKSADYQERELAVQLLGHVGGHNIVKPLLTVIRHDPEPRLREVALTYISQMSWEVAFPILRETSKSDPDSRVREKATYTLAQHEALEMKPSSESFIRKRIATMMGHIIKKGEGISSEGFRVWMPRLARPSEGDIEEVKRYGDDAVPILSQYLSFQESHEKNLAIEFLGRLGGGRIVSPLENVILNDPLPSIRQTALRWLAEAPWDRALPVIERAAQSDLDLTVRQTAQELLDSKKSK